MLKPTVPFWIALVFAIPALAKDKAPFPAIIVSARYVMVTSYSGDESDPKTTREDRQAIGDVQHAIQDWGRYQLTYKPENAELIIVVRKGRLAEVKVGTNIGRYPDTQGTVVGQSVRTEAGDPIDSLSVYVAPSGTDGVPLWRGREEDGLDAPDVRLVRELRAKVEAASKKKP